MPRHSGVTLKCTKVAETPTESSPIQQGEEGGFYLILAGLRMLRGKKVMSQDFFCYQNWKGKRNTYKFISYLYLKPKILVAGNG